MLKKKEDEVGMTLPSFLWLLIFFAIPLAIILTFAFKPSDFYGGIGKGWTLANFKKVLELSYLIIIWRTIWISLSTTLICLSLALPTAYFLVRTSSRVQQLCLLLIILPFWSSFLIRIFAWKTLLHPEGFFKQFLVFLHLVPKDAVLLYNTGAVLLVMIYSYLPFAILPIYTASLKFRFELCEAAMDLGATRLQAFVKIFIPSIKKGILIALLMVFIPAMGSYIIPDIVGGVNNDMIGNRIAQRTFVNRDLPEASALSLILAMIVIIPMGGILLIQMHSSRQKKNKRRGA